MTVRLDRYAPEWARIVVDDLEDGLPGRKAIANAVAALRQSAQVAEDRAILADQHAEEWIALEGKMICADTFARQNRELGQRMRLEAADLRQQADGATTLKGEVIAFGILR